ncbi:MAG TPA: ketoacyl-ACP synthase III [Syntrophales bacterium]|jgi:3-oxoacyl-[acyl-carrier-protein] synthase-3|nr:ketoacyl-ACP synthase III [Syntrophales bacterium]HON22532.1 ketoacyl-ACP synthase III [Syntrophales bacterium]HOU76775.1 ketoacyl-ACP synthase III [Syntrophales bacterium]HPC31898.1 ketoacyl-ACP synthase III [Syntrophales bacterium]HQG33560.1 ketoacyl-ACP synthase III [Syntrophales bacterium]
MRRGVIAATGSYLPETVIANEQLTQFSREAQALISSKTGVRARRHAGEHQTTSDLALEAARSCLGKIDFPPAGIDGIILSTSSPDRLQPATATRLQHLLGAPGAFAFDINSVCSGSAYGLHLADALVKTGQYENILFVAAETYSRILNSKDFATYPYFGDGAGAVLLQGREGVSSGVISSILGTDGSRSDTICVPGGGAMMPFAKITHPRAAYFRMRGEEVFNFTLDKGPLVIRQAAAAAGVALAEIKCFICHQANINILRGIADSLGIPRERFYVNLDRYGNTASASVLIALDEALSEGVIGPGDLVITAAFGGGLSWGANLIRL